MTVKDRIQVRNPLLDRFIKLSTLTGRMLSVKKTPGPYANIGVLPRSTIRVVRIENDPPRFAYEHGPHVAEDLQ